MPSSLSTPVTSIAVPAAPVSVSKGTRVLSPTRATAEAAWAPAVRADRAATARATREIEADTLMGVSFVSLLSAETTE
jgi:hypothetical protein